MTGFVSEIYSQPDVILETVEALQAQLTTLQPLLRQLEQGVYQRMIFTGMGSSCAAVYPTMLRLLAGGFDVRVVEASELLHYQSALLTSSALLVAISQSGRSAEIMPLLDLAGARRMTILGITNTIDSPLHQQSHFQLVMKAGSEATVSTKTYTCTLALLHLLTTAILRGSLVDAGGAVTDAALAIRTRLHQWHEQMSLVVEQWSQSRFVEYLARGYSMASANTAALISKESIKIPTESMNAGQFRHGPLELVDSAFTGMIFTGSDDTAALNAKLAREIVGHGGELVMISQTDWAVPGGRWFELPRGAAELLPISEIIPVQLFCAEFSARRGYIPGQFRYISKVTVQE